MRRCTQGSYRFLRNWLVFTQKRDCNPPGFMVGRFGANLIRGLVNLIGIVALRSNPHVAFPKGPAPAQECLERGRFPLKIALRVIATQLSSGLNTCFIPYESAPPLAHASLPGDLSLQASASPGGCHSALVSALGLKTQNNDGASFSSAPTSLSLPGMVSAGAVFCLWVFFWFGLVVWVWFWWLVFFLISY